MEIKILNSIMFNELMPWSINEAIVKSFNEKLKKANFKDPANDLELFEQVSYLVSDYPDLLKWLSKQKPNSETKLQQLLFKSELPDFTDTSSKYYSILISKEKHRLYNYFIAHSSKFTHKVDIIFNTNQALRNIKALVKSIVKVIEDRGFEDMPTNTSSLTHFVLHYLKLELIGLYFDIQELNKIHLPSIITLEDFYLTELQLLKSSIVKLDKREIEVDSQEIVITQKKVNFGFTGNKENLKMVITELTNAVEFVNRDFTTPEELINILTSKTIKPFSSKIHLGCETTVFRYIIDRLKHRFTNLTFVTIENSGLFFSKNNNQIKATNLSVSKVDNPKNKDILDEILHKLN